MEKTDNKHSYSILIFALGICDMLCQKVIVHQKQYLPVYLWLRLLISVSNSHKVQRLYIQYIPVIQFDGLRKEEPNIMYCKML